MKKLKQISVLLVFVAFAASCGNSDDSALGKKKEELIKLKEERKALNTKIMNLEAEIVKLDSNAADRSKAKLVTIKVIATESFTNYIEIMGKVDADQNTNVSAEIPGTMQRIMVHAGQTVSVGQTLGEIDNTVSEIAMNELKQQIDFAKTIYEKQKNLWDQKIGSEIQYLTSKNNYEGLQKKLATMNQQLGMARIKSPISGVVDEVYAKVGQTVAPGVPCFRIVNSNKLKIKANVAESFAGKINIGNKVKLYFPDLEQGAEGTVSYVSRVIDPINRAFNVEIPLTSNGNYKPNMMAQIRIVDYSTDMAIVVPVNTIRNVGDENFVMVAIEKNSKKYAAKRKIIAAKTYNGQTEITSGLVVGDNLITVGYQELEDGDEIKF
ncbi:MAG: efflux RND transporter periplasmic adaptor subunit [Bacteroidia bacterium]